MTEIKYKIHIADNNYIEWTLYDESTMEPTTLEDPEFNPLSYKLFTGDIITSKYEIVYSPIRTEKNLPGILLLVGKTYGRAQHSGRASEKKTAKFYYKCIPNDKRLPEFLVAYERTTLAFDKTVTCKYVLFKYVEWDGKHPTGVLTNVIGDVTELTNFYEYQLYSKNLFISIKDFTKDVHTKCKLVTGCKLVTECNIASTRDKTYIDEILAQNPQIEDRRSAYVISIDPEHSTDLDDAMGFTGDVLSIYIANVPLIMEYFNLWNSFSERISTIYLPDRKCPMLPSLLSDNLCSLLENELRFAFCLDVTRAEDGEILNLKFSNVLIRVSKNYSYDDPMLSANPVYNNILDITRTLCKTTKYVKEIKDSHDVVAYLMIMMNYESANVAAQSKSGIFRTLSLKDFKENKENKDNNESKMDDEIYNFIKIWQSSSGQYTTFENKTAHDLIGIDNYMHITSPIRRLVDLLNMMNLQRCLQLVKTETKTETKDLRTQFYDNWINRLDYINTTMRAIRKIQTDCNILHICVNNSDILGKVYDGYVFDKIERNNKYLQYTVYIPSIKMIARVNIKDDLCDYSCHKFGLYLIEDGLTLKKKIRVSLTRV